MGSSSVYLSRRAVIAGAGAVSLAAASTGSAVTKKPNILWLVSEDNNPFIGAYGDKLAHTPNIDALSRRGVLYRNVYCSVPVCAPSRFSILTGVPAQSCAPAQHHTGRATLAKLMKTYPELMRQAGYFCTNLYKTDYNCDVDPKAIWDVQGPDGHWRNAPKNKPFLCVINTGATHESQICAPVQGRVTLEQVRVPAYLPDTPGVRQDYATYYNLMEKMDGEIGRHLADLDQAGLTEDTIVFYYSDNGGVLPRSKRFCYEEGQRIALVIALPPKWQHLAETPPGGEVTTPVTLLDLAPTLLAIAGTRQPPQMTGRPLLGHRVSGGSKLAFGTRDRMDERYDLIRTVTDGSYRYIRNYLPHRPWGQHVAFQYRTIEGYREWAALHAAGQLSPVQDRFFGEKPFEELYERSADPDEVHNLIGRPETTAVAARLSQALDAYMKQVNDNGFLAEGMAGEGYFESRDRKVYPLPVLMTIAAAAARRDPRNLPRFVALLESDTPAIRFWAAQGLLMLGAAGLAAREALTAVAAGDAVPQVRVVAAEAAAKLGVMKAVQALGQLSGRENAEPVRLQALNALSYVGPLARAVLPAIEQVVAETSQGGAIGNNLGSCAQHLRALLTGTYDPINEGLTPQQCETQRAGARRFMG